MVTFAKLDAKLNANEQMVNQCKKKRNVVVKLFGRSSVQPNIGPPLPVT